KCRPPLASADDLFGGLAPARVRHLRIDVRPEAVFGRLQRLPQALRACVGETKPHNRLDRFESVLPWHRKPQRRTMLAGKRMAVATGREKRELVGRLGHGEAFDVGPRKPGLLLPWRDLWIHEGFHSHILCGTEWARELD